MLELIPETDTDNRRYKKHLPDSAAREMFLSLRLIGSVNPFKKIIINTTDLGNVAGTNL